MAKITIKEAFQKLSKVTNAGIKNPWFVIRNLGQTFADVADNIEEGGGGSTVEVTQVLESGTKIATITVDDTSTDLYAPEGGSSQVYSTTEHVVGEWLDGRPVYEKTYVLNSTVANNGYLHFDSTIKNADYGWVEWISCSKTSNANALNSIEGKVPQIGFTQSVGMALDNKTGVDINNIRLTIRYVRAAS